MWSLIRSYVICPTHYCDIGETFIFIWMKDQLACIAAFWLTHWGRVTHLCINKPTIIGSDNGLLLGQRQDTIWTNAGILLIGPLGTKVSGILVWICIFSFKKMHLKLSQEVGGHFSLPQCVKSWRLDDAYLNLWTGLSLAQVIQVPCQIYLYFPSFVIIEMVW